MRLRVRFSRLGKLRWTSQRDVARMWERALRRVGLPVAYTSGFSPRPKLSFGLGLPTGAESLAEYLDVEVTDGFEPGADLATLLSAALPAGVDATAFAVVSGDGCGGSLQEDVTSCRWELGLAGASSAEVASRVEEVLGADSLVVTRRRKGKLTDDDLRPSIVTLAVTEDGDPAVRLDAVLTTRPRGVRPYELVRGLGSSLELTTVLRTHQWIERDGARWEPLPLDATAARHALERAS